MLKPGEIVKGVVLSKEPKLITVNLGAYGTGAIYGGEIQSAREITRNLNIGDEIRGKIMSVDNEDGYVELSITEADKQKAWEAVQELKDDEEIVKVKISSFNKGGLVTELKGLPAFLPASQLSLKAEEGEGNIDNALEGLVGSEIEVRVIDVNPRAKKLIVSERSAQEMGTKELAKNYDIGQTIDGVVSGVADFGVFVRFADNPAVEGLVHVSELAYRIVENPKEIVKIDDPVKVTITEIKDGKISLSRKALLPDPWESIPDSMKEGAEVEGVVYAFHPYGAIVNLENGDLQGQVHVADFGSVDEMKKQMTVGEKYTFIIENVQPEEKRITLKLKA